MAPQDLDSIKDEQEHRPEEERDIEVVTLHKAHCCCTREIPAELLYSHYSEAS